MFRGIFIGLSILLVFNIYKTSTSIKSTIITMDQSQNVKSQQPANEKPRKQHLKHALVAGTVAGVGVLAAPLVVPMALATIGFSSSGVVAGSVAAGLQSSVGSVVAGSTFAACQSIAMGGGIPMVATGITGALSGSVGYVGSRIFTRRQHKHQELPASHSKL